MTVLERCAKCGKLHKSVDHPEEAPARVPRFIQIIGQELYERMPDGTLWHLPSLGGDGSSEEYSITGHTRKMDKLINFT